MNIQILKDYFQEFIDGKQHKIMFLNRKKDMFEEFKVIDAINLLEEKDKEIERLKGALQTHEILLRSNTKEIERLNNIINELKAILKSKGYETYIPLLERGDKE